MLTRGRIGVFDVPQAQTRTTHCRQETSIRRVREGLDSLAVVAVGRHVFRSRGAAPNFGKSVVRTCGQITVDLVEGDSRDFVRMPEKNLAAAAVRRVPQTDGSV